MIKEFWAFLNKTDALGLAVAVILAAAFGLVIASLVNDILMPPIGFLLGRVNFSDLFLALDGKAYQSLAEAKAAGAPVIAYGNFINTLINFLIVALVLFLVIRAYNRMRGRTAEMPEMEKPDVEIDKPSGGSDAAAGASSDAAAGA